MTSLYDVIYSHTTSPQRYAPNVRRFFILLVMALLAAVVLAAVAPTLPEGNPLRTAGEGFRAIGDWMARGFGGGYTQLTPG